jgi:hypothetical protein
VHLLLGQHTDVPFDFLIVGVADPSFDPRNLTVVAAECGHGGNRRHGPLMA